MPSKGIMLLGPNEWDDDYHPASPLWLRDYLNPLPPVATPKQIRQAMAVRIGRDSAGHWQGIVMDPTGQGNDEDDADFFHRLEKENNVQAYYFFVPNSGKFVGTAFEAGMLRRDFHYGENPRISLFLEAGFLTWNDDGTAEPALKGKRTRYITSVVNVAQHVEEWRSLEESFDRIVRRARTNWAP